jgi:hypothetical protein
LIHVCLVVTAHADNATTLVGLILSTYAEIFFM